MAQQTHGDPLSNGPARSAPLEPDAGRPEALNRYQRAMLYGGGALVSIVFVLVTAVVLHSLVKDYVAERAAEFGVRKLLVQLELTARESALKVGIVHEESVWDQRQPADPALVDAFIAQHGHLMLQGNPNFDPLLVLGDIPSSPDRTTLARYLALAEDFSYRVGAYTKVQGRSLSGYFYSPDGHFLTIQPAPADTNPLESHQVTSTAALLQRVAPVLSESGTSSLARQLLTDRNPVWLLPTTDPFSRKQVVRLVQAGLDHGKPFVFFVTDVPVDTLRARLAGSRYDEASVIVDQTGKLVLSTEPVESGNALSRRILRTSLPKWAGKKPDLHYRDGLFVFRDQLAGAGWMLIYVFSWRTIIAEAWPRLAGYAGAMLLAIAVIWTFVILLDRKVFTPGYERSQRIFESENLNRTMVSTAPSGLALLSYASGEILLQNDVMRAWGARADASQPPLHARLLERYKRAPPATAWETGLDVQLPFADGSNIDLHASTVRTKYQGTDVLLCNVTDITARKNIERTLEEARLAADAANRAKSTFLATMSHEIRTPLNAIFGHLELLDRSPLSIVQSKRLRTAMSSSTALLGIINDILDLSKVESGQMSVETIRFDLAELAREVAATLTPIAHAKALQFDCMIADTLAPRYLGDPTRIRQIMMNLIGNAIKFTDSGEVLFEVYPEDEARLDSPIVIGVIDSGIGMTPEQQENVFKEFSQADASITRRFGGTGLGLSLCKKLAELMGGKIDFTSEAGVGSTFIVTLPLHVDAGANARTNVDAGPSPSTAPHAGEPEVAVARVLVVDDHPVNRELIHDQLELLGYQSDMASGGMAALRLFGEHRYDMVLTDLNMPGMDGYTLAEFLRDRGTPVPIIAITAHATEQERQRCTRAGIDGVLLKPLSLEALDHEIREQVRHLKKSPRAASAVADPTRGALSETMRSGLQESLEASSHLIHQALASYDMTEVLSQLHRIKGAFAMIHEAEMVRLCEHLEGLGKSSDCQAILEHLPALDLLAQSILRRRAA
ncbi:hybrid two-component system kinase-response regulator protein [Burkholderia lata]|uniref:hybrid sensor histidine kinase/response regulator n=1 Tax=Burkholderia lata (strain ATCC 17760 / DSM 23089 / LMG 22485 / NCIMB 9086 / R18194 / 383) TaxID=482957 RepID=UPI001452D48F|nr:hybrid sensor histidine kinase/response regulator [Burkholderia lata]VWD54626.1 hybrid two-component system kinase-response regulator protein [Burkholderia lata]